MSIFSFLGKVAQGDEQPGGGVFGFLHNTATNAVNNAASKPFIGPIVQKQIQVSNFARNEAVYIARQTPRGLETASLTVRGQPTRQTPADTGLGRFLYGTEPIKPLDVLQKNYQQTLQGSRFRGLATPLSFLGAAATGALDVTGVGGIGESLGKDVMTNLVKAGTESEVKKVLTGKVAPDIIEKIAPAIAKTKDPNIIGNIIDKAHSPALPLKPPVVNPTPVVSDITTAGKGSLGEKIAGEGFTFNKQPDQFMIGIGNRLNVVNKQLDAVTRGASRLSPDAVKSLVAEKQTLTDAARNPDNYLLGYKGRNLTALPNGGNPQSEAGQQLLNNLAEAKTQRTQLENTYTTQRGQKLAKSQTAGENLQGLEGHFAELKALKGQLATSEYPGLNLTNDQKDSLFAQARQEIKDNPNIQGYGNLNTAEAARKVIYGDVRPPTNSEINLLQNAFGKQVADLARQSVEDHAQRIGAREIAGQVLGVPRAIMASADLSGSLRQGLAISTRHPMAAAEAFKKQFKVAFSEKNYQDLLDEIVNHPNYPLAEQGKLAITSAVGRKIGQREEQFASSLAEKIPGLGKIIRGSDRAYSGFLDSIRFNVFNNIVNRTKEAGIDFATPQGDKILKDIAEVINTASGRGGKAGGAIEKKVQTLSTVLFAPRLIASRLQMMNPQYYVRLSPPARKEALTTLLSLSATLGSILGLAKLAGSHVETNPTNADFGKIKVGDTRFDIAGGYQQYIRLGAQLIEGKITSSNTGNTLTLGGGFGIPTRLDIINRFLQGKENPVVSFVSTLLEGKDISGKNVLTPKGISQQVAQRFIPLVGQDIVDLFTHPSSAGPLAAVPGILGVGLQTYGKQDLQPTTKQQKYLDQIKSQGAPKDEINAITNFFQTAQTVPARDATYKEIDKAIESGNYNKANQLADAYNEKVKAPFRNWDKQYGQYTNQDLLDYYNKLKIPPDFISNRLQIIRKSKEAKL